MVEIRTDKEYYVGEHLSGIIKVTVSPELKEADIRLDFELPSGEKFCSPLLNGVNENYQTEYAVPQQCLEQMGTSYIQAIVSLGTMYIEKSQVLKINVNKSVNAVEDFAESKPDLFNEIQSQIAENTAKVNELGNRTSTITIKSWYAEDTESEE